MDGSETLSRTTSPRQLKSRSHVLVAETVVACRLDSHSLPLLSLSLSRSPSLLFSLSTYIYIYFFYLRIFNNGFQSAHLANRQKNSLRLGSEPNKTRRRVEINGSTRDNLRGYNLTPSLDYNASSQGRFGPLWFSSS